MSTGGSEHVAQGDGEIVLRVTPEEAQLVLEALGGLRFSLVYQLIGKIQAQARDQLGPGAGGAG